MHRVFLILMVALLLLGLPPHLAEASAFDRVTSQQEEDDCHCCPDDAEEKADCCDWDFGECCASSIPVALPTAFAERDNAAVSVLGSRGNVPLHLLLPGDNGPPPTPPPIG